MIYSSTHYDACNDFARRIESLFYSAEGAPSQPQTWMRHQYVQNPFGKAIIGCAIEGVDMKAAIVVERIDIRLQGRTSHCGYVSNISIKEGFEQQINWKELFKLLEDEARKNGIDILYFFDHEQSLIGQQDLGWELGRAEIEYGIIPTGPFRSVFQISDLSKPFMPDIHVAEKITNTIHVKNKDFSTSGNTSACPLLSQEYLDWRFGDFSDRDYLLIDDEQVSAIVIMGSRGIVRDAHVLCVAPRNKFIHASQYQKRMADEICMMFKPNIISFNRKEQFLTADGIIETTSHIGYSYKTINGGCDRIDDMAIVVRRWM